MSTVESRPRKVIPIRSEPLTPNEAEVSRQMQICNACRYCEGFCAVFPAMTRRLEFGKADVHYLSNLCHNCGACLHSCQYAPPHEFAVNVPRAMAEVRKSTYAEYCWPPAFGKAYQRNGLTVALAVTAALTLFLFLTLLFNGTLWGRAPGVNFYSIFPHNALVSLFLPVFAFAALALTLGVRAFLSKVGPATSGAPAQFAPMLEAAENALTLKYLDGGHGEGCNNESDRFTLSRRRFHHMTFYGFVLCFAATSVATLYHYVFGWHAPYALPSLPKLLGVSGGVLMVIGTVGLAWLRMRRNPSHIAPDQAGMDVGFIALLFWTAATGLALWLGRSTDGLPALLAVHLGAVLALFATAPYSKFAHGFFRSAALVRFSVERRQPNRLKLGAD